MKKIIVLALSAVFLTGIFAVAKPASAITLQEIQSQLQFLLEQVKQLQAQNQTANVIDSAAGTTASWCFDFKQNLRKGDTGRAVGHLQTALEKEGFTVRKLEKQNNEFGDSTKSAVIGFQNKYKDEVLTPLGKTSGTGFVGETTRAKLNQLYGCGAAVSATTITPTTTTATETMTTTIIPTTTITLDTTAASEPISLITTTITEPIPRPPITSPSITVISPNGGEKWEVGKTYTIEWNYSGEISKFSIYLESWGGYSSGGPLTWKIGESVWGVYDWTIPKDIQPKINAGDYYKIYVVDAKNSSIYDRSENYFSIIARDNWCYDFNKNLKKGDKGKDVAALQIVLEKEGFAISQNEKTNQRFGNSTGAAVIDFQEKYKGEILEPVKEKKGTGFVGKTTRAKLNQLYGCKKTTGSLEISVSSAPVAQTFVRGGIFTFANYNFDTTASSEDVRFPSIPLKLESSGSKSGAPNNLTSCQLYDGSVALNTGLNSVDPVGSATSTDIIPTFNFDSPLTVPKGIVKTLGLQCRVSTASPVGSQYQWGIAASPSISVTGVTSGVEVMETVTAEDGQVITVTKNGTLTVSLDPSSPPYKIASAGASGVTLGVLKFHAANEAINLSRVALQLTNTASSSITDLTGISLWDGGTQVGTAVFTSTRFATSTFTTTVTVPKDGDKVLTVKGDLAQVGTSLPATQGALIAVDYDGNDLTGTRGIGQSSGSTVNSSARDDTKSAGVRMFKSFPTFTKLNVPSTTLLGGSGSETAKDLYRFSVKADSAGSIGIYKFTAYIATTSSPVGAITRVENLKLKAYTDPYFSSPVAGFGEAGAPAGQLNNTIAKLINNGTTTILMNTSTQGIGADFLQIPAGATYYFTLLGDIDYTNGVTSASVQSRIEGDHTYPRFWQESKAQMAPAASSTVFVPNHHDFIWSPNATASSLTTHQDWTNGYYVPGLPSSNMDPVTLVK